MLKTHGQIEEELRTLLLSGQSLGEAIRELHGVRGIGLMLPYPAVQAVCDLSKTEAKRAVVRETFDLRG